MTPHTVATTAAASHRDHLSAYAGSFGPHTRGGYVVFKQCHTLNTPAIPHIHHLVFKCGSQAAEGGLLAVTSGLAADADGRAVESVGGGHAGGGRRGLAEGKPPELSLFDWIFSWCITTAVIAAAVIAAAAAAACSEFTPLPHNHGHNHNHNHTAVAAAAAFALMSTVAPHRCPTLRRPKATTVRRLIAVDTRLAEVSDQIDGMQGERTGVIVSLVPRLTTGRGRRWLPLERQTQPMVHAANIDDHHARWP